MDGGLTSPLDAPWHRLPTDAKPAALLVFRWWNGRPGHDLLIALPTLTRVAAANLVTMTTRLSEMLAAFGHVAHRLHRPCRRGGS
ncbi:hypothetical protein M3484_00360 [Pseudomonas sp. GX19020]|uniref:hypothetical protein n=1 Tax=Pseudomonas sp. GX19020 TaxID=2942277 RepID=UPI002018DEAD|nr:hypothetical protein [Pseudomonas sp. GX19020]MCL4065030.1 hypothetical protein [Pseudomonas sp. GX19020]